MRTVGVCIYTWKLQAVSSMHRATNENSWAFMPANGSGLTLCCDHCCETVSPARPMGVSLGRVWVYIPHLLTQFTCCSSHGCILSFLFIRHARLAMERLFKGLLSRLKF
jgi:hypothetical protein